MTTTHGKASTGWTAWYRRRSRDPWRPIGTASSEATAWDLVDRYPLPGDRTVSSPGRDPNREKITR
jgi:hypothetical protein